MVITAGCSRLGEIPERNSCVNLGISSECSREDFTVGALYGQMSTQELCNTSLQSDGLGNVQKKRASLRARVHISMALGVLRLTAVTVALLSHAFSIDIKAGGLRKVCSEGKLSTGLPVRLTAALSVCRGALENTNGSLMKCLQKGYGGEGDGEKGEPIERGRQRGNGKGRRDGVKENP